MKIRTEYVYPPIPGRSMDWSAVDDDTYDGAPDSNCPIGRGPTEEAAIADLREQLLEQELDRDFELTLKLSKIWESFFDQLASPETTKPR